MTSELIGRVATAICRQPGSLCAGQCHQEICRDAIKIHEADARAAIRVIAPAVLEEAIAQCEWPEEAELNNEFARGMATACCLNRDAIRALKTRYEQ